MENCNGKSLNDVTISAIKRRLVVLDLGDYFDRLFALDILSSLLSNIGPSDNYEIAELMTLVHLINNSVNSNSSTDYLSRFYREIRY